MKAITQDRYGSADVLRLRDIERAHARRTTKYSSECRRQESPAACSMS